MRRIQRAFPVRHDLSLRPDGRLLKLRLCEALRSPGSQEAG
jgi:hypothetical protein